jgi:hypothetical protein
MKGGSFSSFPSNYEGRFVLLDSTSSLHHNLSGRPSHQPQQMHLSHGVQHRQLLLRQ